MARSAAAAGAAGAGGPAAGGKRRNVAGLYPLRPVQQAMLLFSAAKLDPGCIQVQASLTGELDTDVLKRAWQAVVDRHASLRMSVRAAADRDPLIVEWKRLEAPWSLADWSGGSGGESAARMAALLDDDLRHGLDLAAEPAMRFTVIRRGAQRHDILWTCHHLFIDGWSAAIVINDLVQACTGLIRDGAPGLPPPACGYRDYLAWLKRRDADATRGWWRQALDGAVPLPPLRLRSGGGSGEPARGAAEQTLDAGAASALLDAASSAGITASNLVQGAWAILLGQLSGRDDIVFGATVSGRPAELVGVDGLVGMFTNNIPVRVPLAAEQPLASWLRAIRAEQMEAALYAEAGADDIRGWLGLPASQPLFETLVVVENFPAHAPADDDAIALSDYRSGLLSTYPLTLSVIPGSQWRLALSFEAERVDGAAADELLAAYVRLLERLAADTAQTVGALRDWLGTAAPGLDIQPPGDAPSGQLPPDSPIMPASQIQLRLAALFEEVLGLSSVGINQDFFALGGNSMQAVRLFALIEQRLRRKLPLTVLLERPTIAQLAELFETADAAPFRSLVPVRAGGDGTPLICVHAGGEPILFYRHLARELDAGPVYGLQPPGLDNNEPPLKSVGALAARYVEELRAVQPEGPYVLLGYCIGATVCLEMARRLEQDGQTVARMFVLDSGFWWGERPAPEAGAASRDAAPVHIVRKVAEKLRREGPGTLAALVVRNLKLHYDRRRDRAERYLKLRFGSPELRREIRRDQVDKACRHAFERYVPRPCHAPTTLLRTTEYLADARKQRHLAWREVTPNLDERVVEGEHDTMLEAPTVTEVAMIVREYLADTSSAAGG